MEDIERADEEIKVNDSSSVSFSRMENRPGNCAPPRYPVCKSERLARIQVYWNL